jgi:hypothetical protein
MHEQDIVLVAEHAYDLLALVEAHHAMFDIDAGELIANAIVD